MRSGGESLERRTESVNTFSGMLHSLPAIPALETSSREFILFRKIQGAMHFIPNFAETCKAILNALMEEIDAENCSLMLTDPVSGELSIRVARGKSEGKSIYYPAHSSKGRRFKPGEGIAGCVLRDGHAILVNDVSKEPRFLAADGLTGMVRSLVCYPIRERDQIVGVFNVSHSRPNAFSEGDKLALAYISNQIGAALTSARCWDLPPPIHPNLWKLSRFPEGTGGSSAQAARCAG